MKRITKALTPPLKGKGRRLSKERDGKKGRRQRESTSAERLANREADSDDWQSSPKPSLGPQSRIDPGPGTTEIGSVVTGLSAEDAKLARNAARVSDADNRTSSSERIAGATQQLATALVTPLKMVKKGSPSRLGIVSEQHLTPRDLSLVPEENESDEAGDLANHSDDEHSEMELAAEMSRRGRITHDGSPQPPVHRGLRPAFEFRNSQATNSSVSLRSTSRSTQIESPELYRQFSRSPGYARGLRSQLSLHDLSRSVTMSSLDLNRQDSSATEQTGSPTILKRPGYIHRTQTPKGTRFTLQERSPSNSRGGSPRGCESNVSLHSSHSQTSLAGILHNSSASSSPFVTTRDCAEGGEYPFPTSDTVDQNMVAMRWPRRRTGTESSGTMPPVGDLGTSLPQISNSPTIAQRRGHKRSTNAILTGEPVAEEVGTFDPNNHKAAGMAFQSSRHNVVSERGKALITKRLPTLAPPSSSSGADDSEQKQIFATAQRPDDGDAEHTSRRSFEPDAFSPPELQAYADLRGVYAATLVIEKAASIITNVYNSASRSTSLGPSHAWPQSIPMPITAEMHSSLQWARQAVSLFRHDFKSNELYQKFSRNGNDIAARARNDVVKTGGSLVEIGERIEAWEEIDEEEGIGKVRLVRGEEAEDEVAEEDESGKEMG